MKHKFTSHLNSIKNNLIYALNHIYTQYYLSSENSFLLYTQSYRIHSVNACTGRKCVMRKNVERIVTEKYLSIKQTENERYTKTGMHRQGIGL